MLNPLDTVRSHCADLDPGLVEMHFRRLPAAYFERYSAADVARHVRLLAALMRGGRVAVEVRPLASHVFEVVVVGVDHPGTVACITAALAAYGFDIDDIQVAPYLDPEPAPDGRMEPNYFVIVLRTSGSLRGRSPADLAADLRERLEVAFGHLAQGHLLEAQTVAADTRVSVGEPTATLPSRAAAPARAAGHEGLVLGGDFRLERKLASGGMS